MKNKIMRACLPIGLLLYAVCQIVNHLITLSNAVIIPACILSILFMLSGIFYRGRYFGKFKNPYGKE